MAAHKKRGRFMFKHGNYGDYFRFRIGFFRQTTFERRSKVFMHHACSLNKNVNCQKYAVDEFPYDTFLFAVAVLDVKTMVIFTNILIMYELDSEPW